MKTRREFLWQTLTTSAAVVAGLRTRYSAAGETAPTNWPIAIFEKVFEALNYEELADAIAEIGADGVEATIRPGGHIEPAVAADEVPKMTEALAKRGKRIVIAATHIRSVDEPYTETLLRTFKSLGITHYRLGHFYFDNEQPLKKQVVEYAAKCRDLAALNKEVGVQGLYQNHSGAKFLGALAWDAAQMLDGIDPDALGMALDLRHLRAETGPSWKTAVRVVKPHIRSIYLKDAVWAGERSDKLKNVPLDTGFVNGKMFAFVREGLPPMPLCIHMEYLGYRVFEKHEIPSAIKAHQNDIAALRRWLSQ